MAEPDYMKPGYRGTNTELKTRSIPHIWAVLSALVIVTGPLGLVIGVLVKLHARGEMIPPEGYFSFGIFSTLGFWAVLLVVCFAKTMVISGEHFDVFYPFRMKTFRYKLQDITCHFTYSIRGHLKDYKTFHFRTSDGKTYMIHQYEFWNFNALKSRLQATSEERFISRFHNLKCVGILFLISVFLTICLVVPFNVTG